MVMIHELSHKLVWVHNNKMTYIFNNIIFFLIAGQNRVLALLLSSYWWRSTKSTLIFWWNVYFLFFPSITPWLKQLANISNSNQFFLCLFTWLFDNNIWTQYQQSNTSSLLDNKRLYHNKTRCQPLSFCFLNTEIYHLSLFFSHLN